MISGVFCSVKETAQEIGCTEAHVRYLLKTQLLNGKKMSERAWVVSVDSIREFKKITMDTGRPRKNSA